MCTRNREKLQIKRPKVQTKEPEKNKNQTNLNLAEVAKIREETNKIKKIGKMNETKPGLLFVLQNRTAFSHTNRANQREDQHNN